MRYMVFNIINMWSNPLSRLVVEGGLALLTHSYLLGILGKQPSLFPESQFSCGHLVLLWFLSMLWFLPSYNCSWRRGRYSSSKIIDLFLSQECCSLTTQLQSLDSKAEWIASRRSREGDRAKVWQGLDISRYCVDVQCNTEKELGPTIGCATCANTSSFLIHLQQVKCLGLELPRWWIHGL